MNIRDEIIRLGEMLSKEQNATYDLWTWLPSYKELDYNGDVFSEETPSVEEIIREACDYICWLHDPNTPSLHEEVRELFEAHGKLNHTTE